jgi:prophage regulatory protein
MTYTDTLPPDRLRGRRWRTAPAIAATPEPDAIIREPECAALTGLSRSTRWRLERAGQFPRRVRISPSCIGWRRSEIQAWIAERAAS